MDPPRPCFTFCSSRGIFSILVRLQTLFVYLSNNGVKLKMIELITIYFPDRERRGERAQKRRTEWSKKTRVGLGERGIYKREKSIYNKENKSYIRKKKGGIFHPIYKLLKAQRERERETKTHVFPWLLFFSWIAIFTCSQSTKSSPAAEKRKARR